MSGKSVAHRDQALRICGLALWVGVGAWSVPGADPGLTVRRLPEIKISGAPRVNYTLQAADQAQATNWTTLSNLPMSAGSAVYYDASGPSQTRFYRATSAVTLNSTNPPTTAYASRLVWLQPGAFPMGASEDDVDRNDVETPPSYVTLPYGFFMGKCEVTQEEFQSVTGKNPSAFTTAATLPVDSVSWLDASNYCARLTDQAAKDKTLPEGYAFRLPTEAEWEYAARAGSTNRFSFGADNNYVALLQYGWVANNSGDTTHPVGLKKPNAWGLYDMAGNVMEWCADWYDAYTPDDKVNPAGPETGTQRVFRGGSWGDPGSSCRVSTRGGLDPQFGLSSFGFRVVLAANAMATDPIVAIRMASELTVTGDVGGTNRIEYADASKNATNWQSLATVVLRQTPSVFYDTNALASEHRQYRVVAVVPPLNAPQPAAATPTPSRSWWDWLFGK